MSWLFGGVEDEGALRERLRHRLIGQVHVGRLRGGERLPSIRSLARQTGMDHRAVARAYAELEAQGLVEVRAGSGVYVSETEASHPVGSSLVGWLAALLVGGWERRLTPAEVAARVKRASEPGLRCVCMEATEDHMTAITAELEEDFGFAVECLDLERASARRIRAVLGEADLAVATAFVAESARKHTAAAAVPLVTATTNPELVDLLDALLKQGPVTVVVVDPRFAKRTRLFMGMTVHAERVRVRLVDDVDAATVEGGEDEHGPIYATRAARRALGLADYHYVPPPPTFISSAAASALFGMMVWLRLGSAGAR
ncbi:MAG: GntR family transcriptional regulator [Longimicrobiales bacterium]